MVTIAWHQTGFMQEELGRGVRAYVRVIRQRIQGQLRQEFWVFYVFEIVLSESAV